MAVKIRLRRVGAKKAPFYRVVVADSRFPRKKEDAPNSASGGQKLDIKELLILAIATSIDALAVGISFAFLQVRIVAAITLIGCTTFVLSAAGVCVGHKFGAKYEDKATLAGGIILILIGTKILLEHLGFIG